MSSSQLTLTVQSAHVDTSPEGFLTFIILAGQQSEIRLLEEELVLEHPLDLKSVVT